MDKTPIDISKVINGEIREVFTRTLDGVKKYFHKKGNEEPEDISYEEFKKNFDYIDGYTESSDLAK